MNATVLSHLTTHAGLSFFFAAVILVGVILIAREVLRSIAGAFAASRARHLRAAHAHEAAGIDIIYHTHR